MAKRHKSLSVDKPQQVKKTHKNAPNSRSAFDDYFDACTKLGFTPGQAIQLAVENADRIRTVRSGGAL